MMRTWLYWLPLLQSLIKVASSNMVIIVKKKSAEKAQIAGAHCFDYECSHSRKNLDAVDNGASSSTTSPSDEGEENGGQGGVAAEVSKGQIGAGLEANGQPNAVTVKVGKRKNKDGSKDPIYL